MLFLWLSQELRPFNKERPKSEIGIEISKLPINPMIDIIIIKSINSILNNLIVSPFRLIWIYII